MLAYVFWHWPLATVGERQYQDRQRHFHAALAAAPSSGFHRSCSHGIGGAPWAAEGGPAYEDWYLVDDSAALDRLNAAAISASRKAPHDAAAEVAAGGTAGLYTLRLGAAPGQPRFAAWFGKPEGMRYDELMALLRPLVDGGASLWMRFMVLGPTPEFCLQSDAAILLPDALGARGLVLRPVFPLRADR
jgi:hypothetical protein